jgi:hypothetical protein
VTGSGLFQAKVPRHFFKARTRKTPVGIGRAPAEIQLVYELVSVTLVSCERDNETSGSIKCLEILE